MISLLKNVLTFPTQFDPTQNPYVEKATTHPQIATHLQDILPFFNRQEAIADLGCGNGHFLQGYLLLNPQWVGVGVEQRYKRLFKSAEKIKNTSSWILQSDVFDFLRQSPSYFWQEVWLQFPDPWPKKRHAKNRLITPELVEGIRRVLKESGRFCFRSDCLSYWESLQDIQTRLQAFRVTKALRGDLFQDFPRTLYQQKFILKEIPIYSLEFIK